MSKNIFSNAVNDANLSVRVNNDGLRYVGRTPAMDREPISNNRGYNNYNNRSRGGRGKLFCSTLKVKGEKHVCVSNGPV